MLINQNGRNVREVRIKQYSHNADTITVAVDRDRAGHDLSALPLQLLVEAQDIMDVVVEGIDNVLTRVVSEDSMEITWRPQGRHTAGNDRIMCQIAFADCGNVIAYTDTFAVVVEKSLKQIKDCVYADGYTMLDQYLKKLQSIRDETEEIKNAAEGATGNAEAAAKQAQEAATSAARSASEAFKSAEDAKNSAAQASESEKSILLDKEEVEHLLGEAKEAAGAADVAQQGAELAASQAARSAEESGTSAKQAAESAAAAGAAKQDVIKAGQVAVESVRSAKETAVKEVQGVAAEIVADRELIAKNKEDIAGLTAGLAGLRQGKAGAIVDEARGTSISARDSDEAGFDSLTLYGKSTQGSTTGAQLFDVDAGTVGWINADTGEYYNNLENYVSGFIPVEAGSNFSTNVVLSPYLYSYDKEKNFISKEGYGNSFTPQGNIAFIRFCISGHVEPARKKAETIMINKGRAVPYEPYTGGKPSPSPEYPQEIESAGQDGEIGVNVCGGNLFDKSAIKRFASGGGWSVSLVGEEIKILCDNVEIGSVRLFSFQKTLPAGTYTFSISNPLPFRIRIDNYIVIEKGNTSATVTFDNDTSITHFAGDVELGASFNEQRFKIMLNIGSTALPYEPYKPLQTAILKTPDGLPGIPVSSGGNYTDADGQQWVCDTIEYSRGVAEMVQRVYRVDLKTLNWIIQSRLAGTDGFFFRANIEKTALFKNTIMGTTSNIGRLGNPYNMVGDYVWALTHVGVSEVRIGFVDGTIDTLEKLTNLLNSLPEAYAMYCLAEPIRTPLPPETIAAYKALRTYSPTTTIVNDAGAGMSVGYVADTKLYIDKKIDEMMITLANTQAHLL